jgi:hypothetical protein
MTDDPDTLRTYLDRLTELADLALVAPPEDHARMERSIQLVSWALQAVTQARQQSLDEARQKGVIAESVQNRTLRTVVHKRASAQ